jgi:hypothetical protein
VLITETLAIIVSLMQKELATIQKPGLGEAELKATHRNVEVHHRADNTWHTRHTKRVRH